MTEARTSLVDAKADIAVLYGTPTGDELGSWWNWPSRKMCFRDIE